MRGAPSLRALLGRAAMLSSAMSLVMPRPASHLRRSPSPRSPIKTGIGRIGDEGDPAVSSTLHNATAGRFPKKRNAPPHFLAFLFSAFLRDFAQPIADSKSLLLAP